MNIEFLLIFAKYKSIMVAGGLSIASAATAYVEKRKRKQRTSISESFGFAFMSFPICFFALVFTQFVMMKMGIPDGYYIDFFVAYFFGVTSPAVWDKLKPIPPKIIDKAEGMINAFFGGKSK